jgi:hypothetical protein
MGRPPVGLRIGSLLTSILIAVAVIALVGSIMLPSTKRSRFDFEKQRQQAVAEEEAAIAAAAAETQPTTAPASGPTTQP